MHYFLAMWLIVTVTVAAVPAAVDFDVHFVGKWLFATLSHSSRQTVSQSVLKFASLFDG